MLQYVINKNVEYLNTCWNDTFMCYPCNDTCKFSLRKNYVSINQMIIFICSCQKSHTQGSQNANWRWIGAFPIQWSGGWWRLNLEDSFDRQRKIIPLGVQFILMKNVPWRWRIVECDFKRDFILAHILFKIIHTAVKQISLLISILKFFFGKAVVLWLVQDQKFIT